MAWRPALWLGKVLVPVRASTFHFPIHHTRCVQLGAVIRATVCFCHRRGLYKQSGSYPIHPTTVQAGVNSGRGPYVPRELELTELEVETREFNSTSPTTSTDTWCSYQQFTRGLFQEKGHYLLPLIVDFELAMSGISFTERITQMSYVKGSFNGKSQDPSLNKPYQIEGVPLEHPATSMGTKIKHRIDFRRKSTEELVGRAEWE
ncbi:hypothetical protein NEOLEDRAFT_1144937 [Neolentinus lepideus HHB14362 ss-1]|uniref:Uncharacterized protein n=1 Tax=Neolentinus lepideus HHB14362 ss-1 TaxID=1314782 RepID=A0A165VLZ2_9AGAM|nr:hypothetical protein NEOLEDRAFT_1144937 [Neolentinus lepideus HHB14362 ss-1]